MLLIQIDHTRCGTSGNMFKAFAKTLPYIDAFHSSPLILLNLKAEDG